jgi:hypothetical protein
MRKKIQSLKQNNYQIESFASPHQRISLPCR